VTCNWALCPISFVVFYHLSREEKKAQDKRAVELQRKNYDLAAASSAAYDDEEEDFSPGT
jgi:hypothetical protein